MTARIGGSDAAAACGLDRWCSRARLVARKLGWLDDELVTPAQEESRRWGVLHEPLLRRELAREIGLPIYQHRRLLRSPERLWQVGRVDGLVGANRAGEAEAIAELKCVSGRLAWEWDDGPPVSVQLQCQHYLSITGLPLAWVGALIGGSRFVAHRIERDAKVIELLTLAELEILDFVEREELPPPDGTPDDVLAAIYPTADGSVTELDAGAHEHVRRYRMLRASRRVVQAELDTEAEYLRAAMGTAALGTWQGALVVRWSNSERRSVDPEALLGRHPESEDLVRRTPFRRLTVTEARE